MIPIRIPDMGSVIKCYLPSSPHPPLLIPSPVSAIIYKGYKFFTLIFMYNFPGYDKAIHKYISFCV